MRSGSGVKRLAFGLAWLGVFLSQPGLAQAPGTAQAALEGRVTEVFVDRGESYVRAGTAQGLQVGSTVSILGPPIADTKERRSIGTGTVVEVWGKLARVSLDAAALAAPAPKFARVEKEGKAAAPKASAGAPAAPAEASAAAEPERGSLRGHASVTGVGGGLGLGARRIILYNDSAANWTNCDLRLPNNKHYVLRSLEAHRDEGIMLFRFEQDGTPRDIPIEWVNVRCNEGQGRFGFSF